MSKKTYTLGGKTFPTKTALRTFIQGLLTLPPLTDLGHKEFFEDLVRMHWNHEFILGCGAAFFYSQDFDTEMYGPSRCFRVCRVDGSRQKFSYNECLNPVSTEGYVNLCLRRAVTEQIQSFSASVFGSTPVVICPLTGDRVIKSNHHVDHDAPLFCELVRMWMHSNNLSYEMIPLVHNASTEGMSNVTFANDAQRVSWVSYHLLNARLRITSIRGNLSRSKA